MSIVGEWFTGKGALAQLTMETKLPMMDVEFLLGVLTLFTCLERLETASVGDKGAHGQSLVDRVFYFVESAVCLFAALFGRRDTYTV